MGRGALVPELSFADAEAAAEPFSVDQGADEHTLFGVGGVEAVVVFGLEDFNVEGVFTADDLGVGVDAGLQGIHGGSGFARGKACCRCGISKLQVINESIAPSAANSSSPCYLDVTHGRYLNPRVTRLSPVVWLDSGVVAAI
jgi:hypothetical protein